MWCIKVRHLVFLALVVFAPSAVAAAEPMSQLGYDDPDLSTMMKIVETSGILSNSYRGKANTIFAIVNSGFVTDASPAQLQKWLTDKKEALRLLARLVVPGVHKVRKVNFLVE